MSRKWHRRARRAIQPCAVWLAALAPLAAAADIAAARYSDPTTRYAHGILGDAIEHGSLTLTMSDGRTVTITLPETRVFEDTEPRLFDLDGDGDPEVIVVETLASQGAQLAVYDETGKIAATPHIGRTNRWLAPIGAADLDGDGKIEIAYIDRPHLAKTLRVWRFEGGTLTPVAELSGLTNHKIGERDIGGGIRICGTRQPVMITASADWQHVVEIKLTDGKLQARAVAPHTGRASLTSALTCP